MYFFLFLQLTYPSLFYALFFLWCFLFAMIINICMSRWGSPWWSSRWWRCCRL